MQQTVRPFGNLAAGMNTVDPYYAEGIGAQYIRGAYVENGRLLPNAVYLPKFTGLTTVPNTNLVDAYYVQEPGGTFIYLINSDGKVYQCNETTGNVQLCSGTVNLPVNAVVSFFGWTWFLSPNGCKRLDPTRATPTLVNAFLPQPAAPSASASTSGNLNGTYKWKVAFVVRRSDGTCEMIGQTSVESNALSLNNQAATVTIPTSSDSQVVARAIYRTGGTLSDWRFVAFVNDNTTTSFTDNYADGAIVGNTLLETDDRTMPNNPTHGCAYLNRLWLAVGDRVYMSEVNNPLVYHLVQDKNFKGGWFDVEPGIGVLRALVPTNQALLIFKDINIWALTGTTPDNFFVSLAVSQAGIKDPRHVTQASNQVYWARIVPTTRLLHVYEYSGGGINLLSSPITTYPDYITTVGWTVDEIWTVQYCPNLQFLIVSCKTSDVTSVQEYDLDTTLSPHNFRAVVHLGYNQRNQSWTVLNTSESNNGISVVATTDTFYGYDRRTGMQSIFLFPVLASVVTSNNFSSGIFVVSKKWKSPDGFSWSPVAITLRGRLRGMQVRIVIDMDGQKQLYIISDNAQQDAYYIPLYNVLTGREMVVYLKVYKTSVSNVTTQYYIEDVVITMSRVGARL